jgi:hypothetical protein
MENPTFDYLYKIHQTCCIPTVFVNTQTGEVKIEYRWVSEDAKTLFEDLSRRFAERSKITLIQF